MSIEEKTIIRCIPSLIKDDNYSVTSPSTRNYNCIAWAIGRDDIWYWPYLGQPHADDEFWPTEVPDNEDIESFVAAMQYEGFISCDSSEHEEGYTKIALYVKDGKCTHASRLLPSGKWTSKMGPLHDIQHTMPQSIEGAFFGTVYCYMKRKES